MFRLLCNTNLNINIPSRESEEERIRILLRVWANCKGYCSQAGRGAECGTSRGSKDD